MPVCGGAALRPPAQEAEAALAEAQAQAAALQQQLEALQQHVAALQQQQQQQHQQAALLAAGSRRTSLEDAEAHMAYAAGHTAQHLYLHPGSSSGGSGSSRLLLPPTGLSRRRSSSNSSLGGGASRSAGAAEAAAAGAQAQQAQPALMLPPPAPVGGGTSGGRDWATLGCAEGLLEQHARRAAADAMHALHPVHALLCTLGSPPTQDLPLHSFSHPASLPIQHPSLGTHQQQQQQQQQLPPSSMAAKGVDEAGLALAPMPAPPTQQQQQQQQQQQRDASCPWQLPLSLPLLPDAQPGEEAPTMPCLRLEHVLPELVQLLQVSACMWTLTGCMGLDNTTRAANLRACRRTQGHAHAHTHSPPLVAARRGPLHLPA